MTDRETSLYRAYDSQNNLLYIGVSYNFDARKVQHGYYSEWFEQADRFELETFESRVLAETAERDAIQSERPIWNKAHHPDWVGSYVRGVGQSKIISWKTALKPDEKRELARFRERRDDACAEHTALYRKLQSRCESRMNWQKKKGRT